MKSRLSVKNLDVYYYTGKEVVAGLQDISLDLGAGQITAVLGKTGSGKSTLLRAILGTLSSNAAVSNHSVIEFNGIDVIHSSPKNRKRLFQHGLSTVPQNPLLALNPTITCGQQVGEVLSGDKKSRHAEVLKFFKKVNLDDGVSVFDAYPHQVSLGQLQRVCIAMALASDPQIILVDEPFSSLDENTSASLIELFRNLKNEDIGILMITHNLTTTRALADDWIWLDQGKILAKGTGSIFKQRNVLPPVINSVIQAFQQLKANKPNTNRRERAVLISYRNLFYRYPNRQMLSLRNKDLNYALENVNLEIREGEMLGIVGPSGSGKSTLAKIIGGLITDFKGKTKYNLDERPYFTNIQYIMQDASTSLPPLRTIGKILSDVVKTHSPGIREKDSLEKIDGIMAEVGLPVTYLNKSRYQLSGGEKQRVVIARSLLVAPKILVLDESLSALDRDIQIEIMSMIELLVDKHALTVVLVSHDLDLIRNYCERLILVEKGRVYADVFEQ